MSSARRLALVALAALASCADRVHESYVEARTAWAAVTARTQTEACTEEPACGELVRALAAIPEGHADRAEAEAVLERIAAARRRLAAEEARRAAIRRETAAGLARGPTAPAVAEDAPLPGADEVPAFLKERAAVPTSDLGGAAGEVEDGPPRREEDDGGGSMLIELEGDAAPEPEPEELGPVEEGAVAPPPGEAALAAAAPAAPELAAAADPCEPLQAKLAKHRDFLARAAADRDTLGYIEDEEDFHAMWLLRKLRRCGEHPDDPDCAAPPAEAPVNAFVADPRATFREPSALEAEKRSPDEVAHDPIEVALRTELSRCEARRDDRMGR